jgi:hypothetical protein
MESDRVMKIEKLVGLALVTAASLRVGFFSHTRESVAVVGDVLGFFGAILYFRALYRQRKQN